MDPLRRHQRRRRIPGRIAVLAILLGGIERVVGSCDQAVRERAGLCRPLRNADRHRDRDIGAVAALGVLPADVEHAAGDHRALAQGRGRQHDAELVAAGAREQVAGAKARLRHQREMLQAGVARGVAMGVVDLLEAVEIDHEQRERLAVALGARAFFRQPGHQLAAVADAGEVVEQREVGDLVAEPVDRHQEEAEIERHGQKDQPQRQHALPHAGSRERHVDAGEVADGPDGIDRDDQAGDDAGKPGAGMGAAVMLGQQQFQGDRKRQRLADRIHQHAHGHAVVDFDKEQQGRAGEARHEPGQPPGDRPLIEALDAHRGEEGGENHHGAAGKQRQQRAGREHDAHRQQRAHGAGKRRGRPEPRRRELGIAARDVDPDQADRKEIDDEHRPQGGKVQHRDCRMRPSCPLCFWTARPACAAKAASARRRPGHPRFIAGMMRPCGLMESQPTRRKRVVVLN